MAGTKSLRAQLSGKHQHRIAHLNLRQQLTRCLHLRCQGSGFFLILLTKRKGIVTICQCTLDNLHALTDILQCLHICVHAETVQNMSGQSALLRIHRGNDGRAHLMAAADTVTLYIVDACAVSIQCRCQQLLTQQVGFINIKNVIRSTCQNAR